MDFLFGQERHRFVERGVPQEHGGAGSGHVQPALARTRTRQGPFLVRRQPQRQQEIVPFCPRCAAIFQSVVVGSISLHSSKVTTVLHRQLILNVVVLFFLFFFSFFSRQLDPQGAPLSDVVVVQFSAQRRGVDTRRSPLGRRAAVDDEISRTTQQVFRHFFRSFSDPSLSKWSPL